MGIGMGARGLRKLAATAGVSLSELFAVLLRHRLRVVDGGYSGPPPVGHGVAVGTQGCQVWGSIGRCVGRHIREGTSTRYLFLVPLENPIGFGTNSTPSRIGRWITMDRIRTPAPAII